MGNPGYCFQLKKKQNQKDHVPRVYCCRDDMRFGGV